MPDKNPNSIAFIGTGVMGHSMAEHLIKAGHKLRIHTRTRGRAALLEEQGAQWCDTPAEAVKEADFAISIVGYPTDVDSIYFGENGMIHALSPKTVLIDMTTSSPSLAKRIAKAAERRDCMALDAPVSGGDRGAREAKLSIMVGGKQEAYDKALPIFELMGKTIVLQGEAGSGQFTKMANQIAIASGMVGVCEAFAYAQKAGLNPEKVFKSIESGAAGSWSMSNLIPRALAQDWNPGFFIRHFIKDLGIALDSAAELGLTLPGLELAKKLYDQLESQGKDHLGTQALLQYYQ